MKRSTAPIALFVFLALGGSALAQSCGGISEPPCPPAPTPQQVGAPTGDIANVGDPFVLNTLTKALLEKPILDPNNLDLDAVKAIAFGAATTRNKTFEEKLKELLAEATRKVQPGVPPNIARDPRQALAEMLARQYAPFGGRLPGVQPLIANMLAQMQTHQQRAMMNAQAGMFLVFGVPAAPPAAPAARIMVDYLFNQQKTLARLEAERQSAAMLRDIEDINRRMLLTMTGIVDQLDRLAAARNAALQRLAGNTGAPPVTPPGTPATTKPAATPSEIDIAIALEVERRRAALLAAANGTFTPTEPTTTPTTAPAAPKSTPATAGNDIYAGMATSYALYGMKDPAVADLVRVLQENVLHSMADPRSQQISQIQSTISGANSADVQRALAIMSDWTAKQSRAMNSADNQAEMDQKMQMQMDRMSQQMAAMSNIMKQIADTQASMIANIR